MLFLSSLKDWALLPRVVRSRIKKESKNLRPIASLKSVISQIHLVSKGNSVGYNRAYICPQDSKIATIPIGHADGIGRHFGNGAGFVSIGSKKAPIVGNVCMDMIMVDVTNIGCKEGDEVVFFGPKLTISHLVQQCSATIVLPICLILVR